MRQRIALAQHKRELEDAQQELLADDGKLTDLERRRRTAFVRQCELLIERDQAVIDDLELEVSEQFRSVLRDAMTQRGMLETNGRRREAAADEVEAVETLYKVGQIDLNRVLDAQARLADATAAFYRSAVDFERATMKFEFQKGATLERFGYRVPTER